MNRTKQYLKWLFCLMPLTALVGCSLPVCDEGNVVCKDKSGHTVMSDTCTRSRCSVSAPEPCSLYRCQNDTFVQVEDGYCALGSQIHNGVLACIPRCTEGEMVCAVQNENGDNLDIKQSSTEAEGAINEAPCQKYKCTQSGDNLDYVPIENGYCTLGSRIKDGILACTPRCANLPASRCKTEQSETIVQTCTDEGMDIWKTSYCPNSCQLDTESDYDDEGYKAGSCGECRNDMQQYCRINESGQIEVIDCNNGIQSKNVVEQCPDGLQTQCDTAFAFLNSDKDHCGACNIQCTGDDNCINGKCDPCDEEGYANYLLNNKNIRAYCIHNGAEFKKFHDNLKTGNYYPAGNTEKAYILVGDVDYADVWEPLGTSEHPIDGLTLIGQHHTISFTQPIQGAQYAGVFGVVKDSLFDSINIQQVKVTHKTPTKDIEDPLSEEAPAIGGFIGKMDGTTIQNSQFNVEVLGSVNIGGIAGIITNSEIINSGTSGKLTTDPYSSANLACGYNYTEEINGNSYTNYEEFKPITVNLGGIAGYMDNSSLDQAHSNAVLASAQNIAVSHVGGLIGTAVYSNQITSSYRNADINIPGSRVGGLIGYIHSSSIIKGTVIEHSRFSGSSIELQGMINSSSKFEDITATVDCNGIVCNNSNCEEHIKWNYARSGENIGGLVGMVEGIGKLQLIANSVNVKLSGYGSVGGYVGEFWNYDEEYFDSKININIDGCDIYDVKENKCTQKVQNDAFVVANERAAGIIGSFFGDVSINIDNLLLNVNVNSVQESGGGLIGYINGSDFTMYPTVVIKNTDVNATLKECKDNIGGLIGENQYEIMTYLYLNNNDVTVDIDAEENVGGIFGKITSQEARLYNTSVSGNIICKNYCGGIIGDTKWDGKTYLENIVVHDLSIKGEDYIGGIFGEYNGEYDWQDFKFSVNNLIIHGHDNIGSLAGITSTAMRVSSSYVNAILTGNSNIGGMVGHYDDYNNEDDFSILNSIVNIIISGYDALGGITGYNLNAKTKINDTGTLVNISFTNMLEGTGGGLIGKHTISSNSDLTLGNSYQYLTLQNFEDVDYASYFIGNLTKNSQTASFSVTFGYQGNYYYNALEDVSAFIGSYGTANPNSRKILPMHIQNGQFVDRSNVAISSLMSLPQCMMKLYSTANGEFHCLKVPHYANDKYNDHPQYEQFCIAEDQIESECGSL